MAEYSMKARIQLKYDSWENWTSINLGEDKGANLILKQGEIGICADPPRIDNAETQNSPCVMCKVGNGSSKFSELEWMSANAADVYSWAKKSGIVINKIGNGEIVGDISWDEETQALQATMAQLPEMGDIDATLTVEGAAADAKAVGDAIASIPNADWNQSDATQPSYVKNRTHWIEQVDFEWSGNPTFTAATLAEGKIYISECATTDKVFNICTLSCGTSSWVVPVNQSKWAPFSSDSWVSFGPSTVSVLLHNGALYLCAKSSSMGNMGTYNISNCGIVTYLPAAYIPSTIARLKDVVTSVNGQKGTVTIDVPEVNVDGTLSIEGAAADAKAVGDAFDALGILSTKDSVSKSDLASDVQTSLSKADTALQSFTETDPTVPGWAKEATKPTYTASEVGADPTGTASSVASSHNTSTESHNDIRLLIEGLTSRLNTIADSDDTTLDQMSEIVYYIKSNKSLIDSITTSKVNVSDIINNLTTNVSNKPLSAAQGVALKALIDAITVPTKVSELTNDKGYITGYTETDPTVPAWAKASTKPSYTASEIGLATETWTFTLEDGSTVTKAVYVG